MTQPWLNKYPEGIRHSLDYNGRALHAFLDEAAAKYPEVTATYFIGGTLTYRELAQKTESFAKVLVDLGVKKGDRVAVMLPNMPQFIIAFYGLLKAGAIGVPVNPLYTERELEFQLNNSGAETIIALDILYPRIEKVRKKTSLKNVVVTKVGEYLPWHLRMLYPLKEKKEGTAVKISADADVLWFQDLLERGAKASVALPTDIKPEDIALFQYTGGTTGTSKGAVLTHGNLVANALQTREWFKDAKEGQEKVLAAIPFFHVYGMTVAMNLGIAIAATLVLMPRPTPIDDVLKTIQKTKPNMFPGVPTLYVGIINHPDVKKYDLSSITACISGAAPLPVEVQQKFEEITGGTLVEGYGLTEASPVTHANPLYGERKYGSIGLPLPNTDARIRDLETGEKDLGPDEIGELVIRGPQVMTGYWQKPEENARTIRDGWLYTGDVAKMDEDGYFYIVDRLKDMIIAGGYNIYPREVEEVLYEHPKVLEAAVVGVPDEYRGETVKAFVVLKEGETATEEEIINFTKEHLAKYKAPKAVEFRTELPKSLVGKVLRRKLLEEELQKAEAK